DFASFTIRKVALATGAVSTVAGAAGMVGDADGAGAAARFRFPAGLAAAGPGELYVADLGSAIIRRLVVASGDVTTVAGAPRALGSDDGVGPAARFAQPAGL